MNIQFQLQISKLQNNLYLQIIQLEKLFEKAKIKTFINFFINFAKKKHDRIMDRRMSNWNALSVEAALQQLNLPLTTDILEPERVHRKSTTVSIIPCNDT